MVKILTITAMVLLVLLQTVHAEFTYFEYVREPVNPRAMALGGAGTALFGGGYAYYNPAGAAFADSSFVAIDFGQQWADFSRGAVETAWIFEKWFIGATLLGGTVDYQQADETGILPGSGSAQSAMFSLFTGWKKERYAIGIAGNGLPHFIAGENAFAFSASGGVSAIILPNKLSVGAALLHAGRLHRGFYSSKFRAHKDSMATTFRLGVTLCDTIMKSVPVTVSTDAVFEQGERGVLIPVGIEIRPIDPVVLRIGKQFNHNTDVISCGVGLSWDNVDFDAAFVSTSLDGVYDSKWLMGIRYSIPKIARKTERNSITGDTTVITPAPDSTVLHKIAVQPDADSVVVASPEDASAAETTENDTSGTTQTQAPLEATSQDKLPPVAPSEVTDTTSSSAGAVDAGSMLSSDGITDDKNGAQGAEGKTSVLQTDSEAKKELPDSN